MNASSGHTVVGIGEALWDLLPSGKHLGGAPLNFAYISSLLGERAAIASRIGNDALGREIRNELTRRELDVNAIQSDPQLPTGTVEVSFQEGQPKYQIREPVAWDRLEWTPSWHELASRADAVCFGSLAQRNATSRATILQFLKSTRSNCIRVLDINLRKPFYRREHIAAALHLTTVLKMNDVELPEIAAMFGLKDSDTPDLMRKLMHNFRLEAVFVTCGANGAIAVNRTEVAQHPGFQVQVADTIGAGDAFAAAATHCLLRGTGLKETLGIANRWASWVASQPGGMPVLDQRYAAMLQAAPARF